MCPSEKCPGAIFLVARHYWSTSHPLESVLMISVRILGFQSKIGDFLGLSTSEFDGNDGVSREESFLNQLGIAKDVVFAVSISYSFVIIVTALVSCLASFFWAKCKLACSACLGLPKTFFLPGCVGGLKAK